MINFLKCETMQCYNCNSIYNDYLGYCPYCGMKKEEFNVCTECGKKVKKDILLCPECGGKPVKETDEMKSDRLNKEGLEIKSRHFPIYYFDEAIRFNKNNIEAWLNKAEELYRTPHNAIKCCDAALKINEDNPKLLLAKAKFLKQERQER